MKQHMATSVQPHAPDQPRSDTLEYPPLFRAADTTSLSGQKRHVLLTQFDLTLVMLTALFSAAGACLTAIPGAFGSAEVKDFFSKGGLVCSALLLAVALILKVRDMEGAFDHDWFNGRAVAESIKTAAWRYMMRVDPYNAVDHEADRRFLNVVREIIDARDRLARAIGATRVGDDQITPPMREMRSRTLEERKRCYLTDRLDDQIAWYTAKAEQNRRASKMWSRVGLVPRFVALAIILLRIFTDLPSVDGLLTTVAAAATAWGGLRKHGELSKSYALAADELRSLRRPVERAGSDEAFAQAVLNAEAAMAREYTMWMAKRQ